MDLSTLPEDKQREILVGRTFIQHHNDSLGADYILDESYWDSEQDPTPDLRFVSISRPALLAEVVSFDEDGASGFRRAAQQSKWMHELQDALRRLGATGFDVGIWLPEIPVAVGQRRFLADSLARFAIEKAGDLRRGVFTWRGDEVRASWGILYSKLDQMFVSLKEGGVAGCGVGGAARLIEPAQGLAQALQRKLGTKYGPNTHLLVDNQSSIVDGADLLRNLEGKPVILENYEAVWFVTVQGSDVVGLHLLGVQDGERSNES
jgi:hypothetical protein